MCTKHWRRKLIEREGARLILRNLNKKLNSQNQENLHPGGGGYTYTFKNSYLPPPPPQGGLNPLS